MLRAQVTTGPEATELKGDDISDTIAIVERLAGAIERLEAGVAAREAEIDRLRGIAAAANAALADLDAYLTTADGQLRREDD